MTPGLLLSVLAFALGAAADGARTRMVSFVTSPGGASFAGRVSVEKGARKLYRFYASPTDSAPEVATQGCGSQINWKEQWYPLAFEKFTDQDHPVSITVLDTPLAVWFDPAEEKWRAVADICPHRLAPLSEGRVDGAGRIECPYHGWSFEGSTGVCARIPQAEQGSPPPGSRACATAFPCVERQGIIWVWMEPAKVFFGVPGEGGISGGSGAWGGVAAGPDESLIPTSDILDDPETVHLDFHRDVPMDYSTLMENLLDPSHVPVTHHGNIGRRENAAPVPLKLSSSVQVSGFGGFWEEPTVEGGGAATPNRSTEFRAPLLMYHRYNSPSLTNYFLFYALPMAPGRSRVIARFLFHFKTLREQDKHEDGGG
ncbi:unnamed protein product, partial [Discosporangium mesarthrocarpum]